MTFSPEEQQKLDDIRKKSAEAEASRKRESSQVVVHHNYQPKKPAKKAISVAKVKPIPQYGPTNQMLGLLGSLILFLGVFAPIVHAPIVGDVNFFRNGEGDGVFVLVLAVMAVILTLTRILRPLVWIGGAVLLDLGWVFYQFRSRLSEATASMDKELAGNPFRGLADLAVQSVQLEWGWAVLIVGAVLLIAAALAKFQR